MREGCVRRPACLPLGETDPLPGPACSDSSPAALTRTSQPDCGLGKIQPAWLPALGMFCPIWLPALGMVHPDQLPALGMLSSAQP